MAAPKDNKFWKVRRSHGRKPKYTTPEKLWHSCCQYFEWVEENPLQEEKLFSYQGETHTGTIRKMRAMTIVGLCLFLEISEDTWSNYRKKEDFIGVTTRAEMIIYEQKFTGAAAELLNPNIIARDLGLRDNKGVEHSGASFEDLKLNPIDAANKIRFIIENAEKRQKALDEK
jgi:hypothetical protein